MSKLPDVQLFFEEHFYTILFLHIAISLILAYMLHFLLEKRFFDNADLHKADVQELESIEDHTIKGKIAKKLFLISFHQYNRIHAYVMLFFLNFSMPLLGYASALWIAVYLRNVTYTKKLETTHVLNLDEFEEIFNETKRIFGESALLDMMNNPYVPKSKKLQALAAISQNVTPINLKVVQETLKSKDDEIRMFGYAILNKTELSLNAKINGALESLKEEQSSENPNPLKIALIEKRLAYLYWELIYYGFAQDVLEKEFLQTIHTYIDKAEHFFASEIKVIQQKIARYKHKLNEQKETNESAVQKSSKYESRLLKELRRFYEYYIDAKILKGKIAMRRREYEEAIEEFTVAITIAEDDLNSDLSSVYPYIAEIYFNEKRYILTKKILQKATNLEFNTKLYPIIEQWRA